MRASRGRVRGRAISFFMDVKSVFARLQILNVGNNLDVITNFFERDPARHLAARLRLKLHAGLPARY